MWNRIQTYGLAGLAIFAAIVLVACETPAPGVAAPTVSKEIGPISFEVGETRETVSLGDKFKGDKLRYSASTDDEDVALAGTTADNRSIVIRAIGPGKAIITVTATNSGGSVSQSFTVTVSQPPVPPQQQPPQQTPPQETPPQTPTDDYPKDCPTPLPSTDGKFNVTLKINRGLSGECTLPDNHLALRYEHSAGAVAVKKDDSETTANVWKITAHHKGRPVVFIRNKDTGATEGEITVIVPNTPPRWKSDPTTTATFFTAPETGTTTDEINLQQYFEDDDEEDKIPPSGKTNIFRYKVVDKPEGVLIDADQGFVKVTDGGTADAPTIAMEAVVLKRPEEDPFTVRLRAYDKGNAPSDNLVTVKFTAVGPQPGTYDVGQNSDGDFTVSGEEKKLKIGNRIGVTHTINIAAATDPSGSTGFRFAEIAVERLSNGRRIPASPSHAYVACGDDEPASWRTRTTPPSVGTGCYSINSSTNDLDITAFTGTSIIVRLSAEHRGLNETSGATLTITHHVWALRGAKSGTDAVVADEEGSKTIASSSKRLGLNIHRCEVTTDCPLEES